MTGWWHIVHEKQPVFKILADSTQVGLAEE